MTDMIKILVPTSRDFWSMVAGQGRPKAPPGDANCVTEILGWTKIRKLGDKVYPFVLREN